MEKLLSKTSGEMIMQTDINKLFRPSSSAYFIQKENIKKCAKLMARAFSNDPSIRYLLGGKGEGKNDWKYFHVLLKTLFGKCIMLSTDEEVNELTVILPPSLKRIPMIPFLLNGGAWLPFLEEKGLFKRSMKYEFNCNKVKDRFMSGNTWYFLCFVVEPKMQHQGRGSALIKYVLESMDHMNAQIYLETHKTVNVEIYKHFGFELKDTSVIPDTNILQYAMLR